MSDTELHKQWVAQDGAALSRYLDGYAFDNAYTPTADELRLLDDALHGWDAEQFEVWLNRIAATRQPDPQVTALVADNERLRVALRRCGEIVENWNGRQTEKVEDVRHIARNALNAWEQSNG